VVTWTGWLEQQKFISHSSWGLESRSRLQAKFSSWPGSYPATSSPCPQMVEREGSCVSSLSYKDTNTLIPIPIWRAILMDSSDISQGSHLQVPPQWRLGLQHLISRGLKHSTHSNYTINPFPCCRNPFLHAREITFQLQSMTLSSTNFTFVTNEKVL
jgi:hypothetical protein